MGGNIYADTNMEPFQIIKNTFDTPDYSNDAEMNALFARQKAIVSTPINPRYTMASAGDSTAYSNANEMNFVNGRIFDNSAKKGPGFFDKFGK